MSEQWEFYPCQMGGHQAFIFYDHGIRHEIDGLPLANALKPEELGGTCDGWETSVETFSAGAAPDPAN